MIVAGEINCVKCGSDKIVPLASIEDLGRPSSRDLWAYVFTNPEAWIFKGPVHVQLRARICGECGHTELFAQEPEKIYEAFCAQLKSGGSESR